jgi:hypothetical protein
MAGDVSIKMWTQFGSNESFPTEFGTNNNVASEAVRAAGLVTGADIGGSLGALDIKRMDCRTAISMSLIETFVTTGDLYELVADDSGGVEFIKIGGEPAGFSRYYYSTQTTSFNNDLTDVLVTGGKPLPEIKLATWHNVLENKEIYTQQTMFENCRRRDFYKYATVVYPDPHLDTQYNDGIANIYNITNAFEKLVGYIHYKNPNLENRPDVKINWANESSIPIKLHKDLNSAGATVDAPPNIPMGSIQEIRNFNQLPGESTQMCFGGTGDTISYTNGVKIDIPTKWRYKTTRTPDAPIDTFIRVSAVYLIGIELDLLFYAPKSQEAMFADATTSNSIIWASINKYQTTTQKCEEGRHYAIAFDESNTPYVVFGKETRNGDPFPYGAGTKFRIDPVCNFARAYPQHAGAEFTGTVFPVTKTSGMLVFDIWVVADVEIPSINIFDPAGQAHTIAEKFEYHIKPMTIIDKPAPIASAKVGLIEQSDSVKDADPTAVQDLSNTALDSVLDNMQGAGMTVTWSFLDETQVATAATNLYKLMDSQNAVETVYTCGPDASPSLGADIYGGYINAIRYSYTDQGSYTISITVGPMLSQNSIVSVDGGPTAMMVEDVGAKGVVIQSAGDNINFKVRIDGYGERWAVCMTPSIIRVGDVVQCSVHNNPVEH